MATWRYCDDFKPHEMHEWSREVPVAVGYWHEMTSDSHNCPGIKDGPGMSAVLGRVSDAEAELELSRTIARNYAKRNRRTISEAMNCTPEHYYGKPDTLHLEQP